VVPVDEPQHVTTSVSGALPGLPTVTTSIVTAWLVAVKRHIAAAVVIVTKADSKMVQ
jgi:hypothetical protein